MMSAATAMCTKGGLVTFLFQSTADTQTEGGEVYAIGKGTSIKDVRIF